MANRPASTRFSAPFPIRFHPAAIFRRGTVGYRTNTGQIRDRVEVTGIAVKRNRATGRRDLILPLIRLGQRAFRYYYMPIINLPVFTELISI